MSLTESAIMSIAEKHGCAVLKRVTTGNDKAHFATFELSGPLEAINSAWAEVHDTASTDQLRGGFVYLRASDADFTPYIGIESIWCEPQYGA